MPAFIQAFGSYLPARIVSNPEIGERTGKSAEWIEGASGISERRWARPNEGVVDMARAAATDCLTRAGAKDPPGLVIVSSGSASRGVPGPAASVASRLGYTDVPALDIPMASAGSLYGLALGARLTDSYGSVLVIASEKMSEVIEGADGKTPLDPNTAILFGDGAGAVLLTTQPGRWEMIDSCLHTDGAYSNDLAWDGAGAMRMNGLSVILHASRKIPAAIQEVLAKNNLTPAEVKAFLLHQANLNLLTKVARTLGIDPDRVYANVQRYGNTSSASMLIAAAEWAATKEAQETKGPVVFGGFGAGYHWGAVLARLV